MSRHQYTETPIEDFYLGLWVQPTFQRKSDDLEFTLESKYHRRPDRLSKDLYGTESYWWVFALYNKDALVDPFNDFVSGMTIIAPLTMSNK